MSKKSVIPKDEAAAVELSARLSNTIMKIATRRGFTQTSFAQAIGMNRVSLCQILNSTCPNRMWNLTRLCAAARVLHLPVYQLLLVSQALPENGELPKYLAILGTTPGSPERLTMVVREVLDSQPGADEVLFGENYEAIFGCRPVDFKHGAPEFFDGYTSRAITDRDAAAILVKAYGIVSNNGGLGKYPLWAAVKAVMDR